MAVYIQEPVKIYRELEICPNCGEVMQRTVSDIVYATYPPQYTWKCYHCETAIVTTNSGEVKFDWKY